MNQIHQVTTVLRYTYGLVPIVAGLDKFTNLLTNWAGYLPQNMIGMLPFPPSTFMMIVGVIEIIAGVLVLIRPAIGAWIVSAWLVLIALQLIIGGILDNKIIKVKTIFCYVNLFPIDPELTA